MILAQSNPTGSNHRDLVGAIAMAAPNPGEA
jgi:hypothetical protein